MKKIAVAALLGLLLTGPSAFAHRVDEYLQASLVSVGKDRVDVSMRMIPGVQVASQVIAAIDADGNGAFSDAEERTYAGRVLADLSIAVDGEKVQPRLGVWSVPQPEQLRDGIGEIHIEYSIDLPGGGIDRRLTIENRHFLVGSVYLVNAIAPEDGGTAIIAQRRNALQSTYELEFEQAGAMPSIRRSNSAIWSTGAQLTNLFRLGMRHIADGTDHLLFLLVLLLPAPLIARKGRWGATVGVRASLLHVFGIVTAFTAGHSLTLALAVSGVLRIPARPVEVLIAVSIFVSAIHALRPIFPGCEAYLAGGFGLVHGLAFATTLDRLGLTRWDRVEGILSFNLGIETMQMVVVAAVLPSLLLISGTRPYAGVRIAGGSLAAAASLGWMVERVVDVKIPLDAAMKAVGEHGVSLAAIFFAASLGCRLLSLRRDGARVHGLADAGCGSE